MMNQIKTPPMGAGFGQSMGGMIPEKYFLDSRVQGTQAEHLLTGIYYGVR